MKPDLHAIRARCEAATPGPWGFSSFERRYILDDTTDVVGEVAPTNTGAAITVFSVATGALEDAEFIALARTDIPKLLAYIDDLEHERDGWKFNALDARDQIAILEGKHPVPAELWPRITYVVGQEETANRIAHAEARVADLEAEVDILRHRDALLKRVHGALADMCCRVPTSIDEPVDAIVRDSLARANQRFVTEYDARTTAEEWANELRAELFDWQDAVGYVLGDNWSSEDGHDAKAARRALAEWAAKAQGEAPQLLAEIAELKARVATLEAMR